MLPAAASSSADVSFIWVAGFHHSGTSLVNLLMGEKGEVALMRASSARGEGQHSQTLWPTISAREKDPKTLCAPLSASLCLHAFDGLLADDAARLSVLNGWETHWSWDTKDAPKLHVEKDPDWGSVFYKLRLFPPTLGAAGVATRGPEGPPT